VPRRRRIDKRRDEPTLERHLLLTLGPLAGPNGAPNTGPKPYPVPGSEEWEALRTCWLLHRDYFAAHDNEIETYWGYRVFEAGEDPWEASNKLTPVEPGESSA
jgi:hypothetical protein